MALSFPSSPQPGDTYLSYIWDGVKWGVQAGVGGVAGVSSLNTRTGSLTLLLADVTGATGSGSTAQASLGLATVAASGAYADLSGAPSLASYAPIAAPVFTGDARAVTPAVGDNDTSIATTAFVQTAVAPAANNVGRNLLHNPLFNVAQRGAGPFTALNAYTLDRWIIAGNNDTFSVTAQTASDAVRTGIGDEAVSVVLANTWTGNAAAGAYNALEQPLEDVRRLAGKTVTLSFWAVAGSGTLKVGVNYLQSFGTGGSPSTAGWSSTTGQSVTVNTTWTRYTVTTTIASTIGKTLGTNNNSSTNLTLAFSSGATNNAIFGSIGVQSGTINIWGVQLEIGSAATQFEKLDPQQDLAKCQRFYQLVTARALTTAAGAGAYVGAGARLSPSMRATPTVTAVGDVQAPVNTSQINADNITAESFRVWAASGAAGQMNFDRTYAASADL